MKRKKWSELEEQTLMTKYSELVNSGTLAKLKTREKKFKPIADHVNAVHHLHDPINYPFKWTWRDVSIKIQNMRHQYLGVKQKIRVSDDEFNWDDGENYWENFLKYKEVFGDVKLEFRDKRVNGDDGSGLGLGFDIDCGEFEEDGDDDDRKDENGGSKRRRIASLGAQVLELKNVLLKREQKRREREFVRENGFLEKEGAGSGIEDLKEKRVWNAEESELELEEMQFRWARREFDKRDRELDEMRRLIMKMEEKREEEETEWKEKMLGMQIEHEKQMMQMHANACQNQMQIIGVMVRLMCQFFGSSSDGLNGGLDGMPPQVLQNLHPPNPDLGDDCKPGSNLPSEFI